MSQRLEVCVLAAGLGKRMKSGKPKPLHEIAGRPMLDHLLSSVAGLSPARVHVVVGKGADAVRARFSDRDIEWAIQDELKGTGHAVMQALPGIDPGARLLVLLGDAPLLSAATMKRLIDEPCDVGVLTVDLDDPHNYGRILRSDDGNVLGIVEERDASEDEKRIREINTGAMVMAAGLLAGWLGQLSDENDQREYLLTDIIAIAANEGRKVHAVKTGDPVEVAGVNTFEQLARLERAYQQRQAGALMAAGVHLADPSRIDIRGTMETGQDVSIDINCIFEGHCAIGSNVSIGPNCVIRNARIGDNCEIRANSVIDEAVMDSDCIVGPFARLRPGTRLEQEVAIGNFVEVKKATIGKGTKASHLSYLGDANIGAEVNIGAGTITCNYDGVDKHVTNIEDHVFVGSNTALVAPVTIGEGSTIAAGSTITRSVEARRLAIARGRQKSIAGWKGPRDS